MKGSTKFTKEDDQLILKLVEKHGKGAWSKVKNDMGGHWSGK